MNATTKTTKTKPCRGWDRARLEKRKTTETQAPPKPDGAFLLRKATR